MKYQLVEDSKNNITESIDIKETKFPQKQPTKHKIETIGIDDLYLWMFLRILTRNRITTQRLPKRILEPIFKSFINKKLTGSE